MDEYIKRKAALEECDWYANEFCECEYAIMPLKGALENLPAADVRPVVLCRECVHWERYDNTAGCGYCHKVKFEYGANGYVFNPVREPDFYCADGRKADV